MTFISEEKGYISASKKRGGRSEPCFFYPQDLGCELKKGDYVCFDVNVNAKRQGHHHLKAFNVEAKGSSNNTQQAKTSARLSGVSNGDSASAHSTSGVRNNMEDLYDARMKRMEDMMASMSLMLSQRWFRWESVTGHARAWGGGKEGRKGWIFLRMKCLRR